MEKLYGYNVCILIDFCQTSNKTSNKPNYNILDTQ